MSEWVLSFHTWIVGSTQVMRLGSPGDESTLFRWALNPLTRSARGKRGDEGHRGIGPVGTESSHCPTLF